MGPPPFNFSKSVQENQAIQAAYRAKQFFESDATVQCNLIASGARAVILLVRDKQTKLLNRKYVMKKALVDDPGLFEWEVEALQELQNAPHVAKLASINGKPLLNPLAEAGLQGDHYFMQYYPRGSLAQFLDRTQHLERLPNRLLIAIFLCAAKACAAMAYPPGPERDRFGYLPFEKAYNDRDPSNLVHWALRGDHWLFGETDYRPEHALTPIMSLIGFGSSQVLESQNDEVDQNAVREYDVKQGLVRCHGRGLPNGRRNTATRSNVLGVGMMMATILNEDYEQPPELTRESLLYDVHKHYDKDLYRLVKECIAVSPPNRPTIQELIDKLYDWIWSKVAEAFGLYPHRDLPSSTPGRALVAQRMPTTICLRRYVGGVASHPIRAERLELMSPARRAERGASDGVLSSGSCSAIALATLARTPIPRITKMEYLDRRGISRYGITAQAKSDAIAIREKA
ncbi:hypothetical protein DL769_010866 [Monosporascus sp. CRB-8-3]|nr:hypothetical protein DL769_010866 [Monosporascus sp. CRB-8-3]